MQVPVKVVQKLSLTLHPMPESKSADSVKVALKSMGIIPVKVHEPDRAKKTIQVDLSSIEDAEEIKRDGITMKPQNVCPFSSWFFQSMFI